LSGVVKDALTVGVRVIEYDSNHIVLSVGDHVERVTEPVNINELFPELIIH
jgi:glutamate--cysteine ligase